MSDSLRVVYIFMIKVHSPFLKEHEFIFIFFFCFSLSNTPIPDKSTTHIYCSHFLPLFRTLSVDRFKRYKNQRVNTKLVSADEIKQHENQRFNTKLVTLLFGTEWKMN